MAIPKLTRGLLKGMTGRLTFRLLVLLTMALLPLGAISISATAEMQRAAQRAGERGLITLATDAVAGERALIESALASSRALESLVLERRDDIGACSDLLRSYVERTGILSFAGFIDADGVLDCRSHGDPMNFGSSEAFQRLRAAPMTTITTNPNGQATGLPVIIVSRPMLDQLGLVGFLSISIARSTLEAMAQRRIEDAPQVVALINHTGAILNLAPEDERLSLLPPDAVLSELATTRGSRVLRETTRAGVPAVLSMAELVPGRLYALAVWDPLAPALQGLDASPLPLLFPAAMWLACLAVVLLAIHYLVLRHLKDLNSQMRRFALGRREDWASLPGHAPAELRELGGTFRNMARLIARDEDERERALAEKTVLLKEIHHRVKNNLQLIASVINLQLRQLADPAARRVLQSVQHRVLGLASVHRALYAEDRLARVRADRVIEDLLSRVVGVGAAPGHAPQLRLNMAPLVLDADQMVPLSFLLHEAVANALKHLAPAQPGAGWIAVDLKLEGAGSDADERDDERPAGTVVLLLRNPLARTTEAEPRADIADGGDGLGQELIDAFALQLGGTCRQEAGQGPDGASIWQLELRFPATAETGAGPVIDRPGTAASAP